ncbi:hypothetical protein [Lactobacillus intestinalis]|uniref:hypothetical protein n=1 Tax=Lactobacillus intestinalis TaxID=151781 RepID=UPI002432CE07|nr:hypothetical protein [Lactobacillus intestinalis]
MLYKDNLKQFDKLYRENLKLQRTQSQNGRRITDLESKLNAERKRRRDLVENVCYRDNVRAASPELMIDLLRDKCSVNNVTSYRRLTTLNQVYDNAMQDFLSFYYHEKYSYGYIETVNDQYILHDINQNQDHPVILPDFILKNTNFDLNTVVRCHLNDNASWGVDHFYRTISFRLVSKPQSINKKKSSKKIKESQPTILLTNPEELVWLASKRIVIVGDKYSVGFLNEIKKYCSVETFNGYKDGERRIFDAMHRADYVFMLIGSVLHAMTVYTKGTNDLNENTDKVQTFDVPAKYDGVIRLHYLYANH